MKKIIIFVIGIFSYICFGEMERQKISLTIYNQNFALVRDVRQINLKKGIQILSFDEVASEIDPTSVYLFSLTFPKFLSIREQNFEYDLLNPDKLLNKYLNKEIEIITKDNNIFKGFLSSFNNTQLIISKTTDGPLFMINRENIRDINFSQIPEGLITKPTLVLDIENGKEGIHQLELTYLTSGINWKSDYVLELGEKDDIFDINGWVTIDNKSGATYKDANIKLIAGDVRKIEEVDRIRQPILAAEAKAMGAPQFEEKEFFEYHLYSLIRPTTLKNNQTKQISFLSSSDIPVKKVFVYDGAISKWYHYENWGKLPYNKKVSVFLQFKNSKDIGLGIPLPKGKIRVYKKDTDGTSQFIGEDIIDHTPKDETLKLKIGEAFDIIGERKVIDHKKIAGNVYRDSYEISLRNHKKEKVVVEVIEHLYGIWEILSSSLPYEKVDASTIKFIIEVPSDKETKVNYTAQYTF